MRPLGASDREEAALNERSYRGEGFSWACPEDAAWGSVLP